MEKIDNNIQLAFLGGMKVGLKLSIIENGKGLIDALNNKSE